MALTIDARQAALFTVVAVSGGGGKRTKTRTSSVHDKSEIGRRGLVLTSLIASSTSAASQTNDSRTALLQRYLKKSEENKIKNDKERLDDYYKRNYKDYFEFIEGSITAKKEELSESEKGILDWLKTNK